MAWRICKVPGCTAIRHVQPFNIGTRHPWLCPTHRQQLINKRIDQLALAAKAKRMMTIMTSK